MTIVDTPATEIAALAGFDPRTTAIVPRELAAPVRGVLVGGLALAGVETYGALRGRRR